MSGAIWLKMMMHRHTAPDDSFIITSPTYKIFSQSTLPPFLRVMDGYGRYDRQNACFRMHSGGTCWFRTGTDPDSVVGLTNVRAVLSDEAGLYSLYFWENIQGRAAFKEAPIRIVTSPYSLNWLYKDIIRPKTRNPDSLPDVELIQARSDENPYFPKTEYERRKASMDSRRFNMMFGGAFDKMEGIVYDCFDEYNISPQIQLPVGTLYYAGVDWGTTNPFAIVVRAITPSGQHFQVSETYKTGYTITDMVQTAKAKAATWGIRCFHCDPSQPGYIEEFCRAGLVAVGADNDIRLGIDRHYELIKTKRLKVFAGTSRHTLDEYDSYHYPSIDEQKADKNVKEKLPVEQNNHAMDANRYVTMDTWQQKLYSPTVAIENKKTDDIFERIEQHLNETDYHYEIP